MARPFFSAIASLARSPVAAEERLARRGAFQAAFDAERDWLKRPCPTSLAGFKVAVVGAGLAGLSAASTLARLGMRVHLYEARDDVGGRVDDTTHFRARVVDTGAELIGAIHPMCLTLAREHGIALITRTDDEAAHQMQLTSRMLIDGTFLNQKELLELTRKMHDEVLLPIARHARVVADPAAPWKQTALKDWDGVTLGGVLRKHFGIKPGFKLWQMLEILLVNDNVAPLDELNYLALLCLVRAGHSGKRDDQLMGYWEDLENFRCSDGCHSIARHMRDELARMPLCELRLSHAVTAIDLAGVPRVTWNRTGPGHRILPGSQTEDYDYVVLATPPTSWHHITVMPKDLDFPAKPGKMRMGPAIKFFAGFDERFWIKQGFAALGGADKLGQVWESTDNQTRFPEQQPVLAVYAGGIIADDKTILGNVEKLYPGFAAKARKPLWARWPSEPFIECGLTSPAKGEVFRVGAPLNEPFAKRMCFAGEHTSMAYFGYMEGALRSGLRAALQIVTLACGTKPAATPPPRTRIAEAPEPPAEAEVIGNDDRGRIVNTLAMPYRWICAIDVFFSDDASHGTGGSPTLDARATGILIGPRHVLTAAHIFRPTINVHGQERQLSARSVRVSPARNGDNEAHPFGYATATRWHAPSTTRNADDYALIVLDQDLSARTNRTSGTPLGWWPLRSLESVALGHPVIDVAGYPGDRCGNDKATGTAAEKLATIAQWLKNHPRQWASTLRRGRGRAQISPRYPIIVHDADTYSGESGAPICVRSGSRLEVLGVHTNEVTPAEGDPVMGNQGVRVTRDMLANLTGWINADAGRAWARVQGDTLVFDAFAPAVKEATDSEFDPGGEYEAIVESESATQAERKLIRAAARKIDAGLRAATLALAQSPAGPTRELAEFIVALLRTHFFPSGFGEVGSDRKVLKPSARALIEMTIEKDDGSRWPFLHRVLLSLATPCDRAWVAGEAGGQLFSVITLYVPDFDKLSEAGAASVAVHECVHMLFRMIEKLRQHHGEEVARRFVAREPWRRLDTQPLEPQRRAVAAQLEALRKLLPMEVGSEELATSLVQEAFAYTLSQWIEAATDFAAAARKSGPKVVVQSVGIAPILMRHYVLERAPGFAASLTQPEVVKAVQALAPALEAVADALHRIWGPMFTPSEPNPSAREVLESHS